MMLLEKSEQKREEWNIQLYRYPILRYALSFGISVHDAEGAVNWRRAAGMKTET